MIYVTQNRESGQLHTKKPYHGGCPENTERTYTVHGCQVRCVTRANQRVVSDEHVATAASEQVAEALARELANPVDSKQQGRRVLEELMEDQDAG